MSHNTRIHRIARRTVIRPLAMAGVTPNQVTTVRLLSGITAAGCFAAGTPTSRLAGSALFVVSFLLDRVDGDLARTTGKTSPGGHIYDLVSDTVCNALIFVGLGFGMTASSLGSWAVIFGLIAGSGVAVVLMFVIRIERVEGVRAAELNGIGNFDPDDAILIVPIAVALDAAEALLIAAAVGTPIFVGYFLVVFRRKLFASREYRD